MQMIIDYKAIRTQTELICKPLKVEDYVPQPVPFASPPKWHLAHTTWFFEEMILKQNQKDYKPFHADFGYLFNSYYNTAGKRTLRADRGNMTRPTVDEVYAYRRYVDEAMFRFLESNPDQSVLAQIALGLNHEQQHQELLLTDLKYTLGHNPLFPVYQVNSNYTSQKNTTNGWLTIPEGIYEIGSEGKGFYFDNEMGRHKVYSHPFEISKALVTNGEYLEFMNSEGYQRFDLWLDEGWHWVQNNQINTPLYWHKMEGEWYHYTLAGFQKINPDEILCHISYYEANAFAAWKKMRLPTEFEWEIAADDLNWGQRWEWTNSAYLPYPQFQIAEGALGEYNGKFMINQMVLRGASRATAAGHSRKTYRNFFHPHFQWQFSGIRLVK